MVHAVDKTKYKNYRNIRINTDETIKFGIELRGKQNYYILYLCWDMCIISYHIISMNKTRRWN